MKIFARVLVVFLVSLRLLPAADLPPVETVKMISPLGSDNYGVYTETKRMLDEQDTGALEALAKNLRETRDSLDNGQWFLTTFYDAAVRVPKEPDAEKQAMEFYEKWAKDRPQSITAQVCLALALVRHAWNARGTGWANTVTEDGWRLMRERLARAAEVLEQAKTLEEKCPGWYSAAQVVALGQGWDREKYLAMVDEAIDKEPTFAKYYTQTCYWMLPRWYGKEGDFEKWIAQKADTQSAEKRDMQYARLVWAADRMGVTSEIVFGPGRLDWARAKRGFEQWIKETPDYNLPLRFEFIRLALLADDRETAKGQFDVTGGKYYPPAWNGQQEMFEAARAYAYSGGPNPLSAPPQ